MLNKKNFVFGKLVFVFFCLTLFLCLIISPFSNFRFLNLLPLRKIKNQSFGFESFAKILGKQKTLQLNSAIIGGEVYCFELKCDGVIVKEFEDVKTLEGFACPLKNSGIKVGCVITKVNDENFYSASDFVSKIENSDGSVKLTYTDKGKEKSACVFPALNISGKKKIGLWIKDDISGTGTVSFSDGKSGKFYALGHNICDFETGAEVSANEGVVRSCKVMGAEKSVNGKVGELRTVFNYEKIGSCRLNGKSGIVGTFTEKKQGDELLLASPSDISVGKALVYCTIGTEGPKYYQCEIIKISPNLKNKNLTIRITDKSLINQTGGIVQGMSGSPIVQDGKIVGVLTHSFVNNPKIGFASLPDKIIS